MLANRKCMPFVAAGLWFAAIWLFSSLPMPRMGKIHILGWDKLIHVVQYLVLALLVNRCLVVLKARRRTALLLYIALLASAALDEWHQTLIPNRTVTVWDFAANALGLALGYIAYRYKDDPGKQSLAQH